MRHSTLSEHKFNKGEFITPLNSLPLTEFEDVKTWSYGRMPEYLWIGLILKYYGRENGMIKCNFIMNELHRLAPKLSTPRISEMLKLDSNIQRQFYSFVINMGCKDVLAPLTVFITVSKYPVFAEMFYCKDQNIEDRCKTLLDVMEDILDQHSNEAIDVRFIVLYFCVLSGKMKIQKVQADILNLYPISNHDDEIMRMARPLVGSSEMMILAMENVNSQFINDFWRILSKMTDCDLIAMRFPEENRNIVLYMEYLHEIFLYLSDLYITTDPLNEKMKVLLGIATYSYKRLKEIYDHQMFNSISGRSCVRILIEDYIMMKYLLKNESSHQDIWREYQMYGMGSYKLVLKRLLESESLFDNHFDQQYIEGLVNEYRDEEFLNMDTKYFDKQNIRLKAADVEEKELYGLYYDYDSSFEHGLWGAIRESSFLKCMNPAHKYHCVPDVENQNRLKSVLPDCIMIMNKTLIILNELYAIPDQLFNGVINFEVEPITK